MKTFRRPIFVVLNRTFYVSGFNYYGMSYLNFRFATYNPIKMSVPIESIEILREDNTMITRWYQMFYGERFVIQKLSPESYENKQIDNYPHHEYIVSKNDRE